MWVKVDCTPVLGYDVQDFMLLVLLQMRHYIGQEGMSVA